MLAHFSWWVLITPPEEGIPFNIPPPSFIPLLNWLRKSVMKDISNPKTPIEEAEKQCGPRSGNLFRHPQYINTNHIYCITALFACGDPHLYVSYLAMLKCQWNLHSGRNCAILKAHFNWVVRKVGIQVLFFFFFLLINSVSLYLILFWLEPSCVS